MAETLLNNQEQKIETITDRQKQSTALREIIGWVLAVIMIGLTAYAMVLQNQNVFILADANEKFDTSSMGQAANYRSYVGQYKDTKLQLEETTRRLDVVQQQLDQVSAELAQTKGMLSETQAQLVSAQEENARLRQEIVELDILRNTEGVKNVDELDAKIRTLKKKNVEVTTQLDSVKNELRAFQADFSNLDEGKSLVVLFQNKIKLVKSRMRYLKQEAYFARVEAQKERDRIEALNGNNGFIIRDGQPIKPGNAKGFAIDVKIVP